MARLDALSMFEDDGTTELLLAELYGAVIDGVEAGAVSVALKNQSLSGDPAAGSVEAKRFVNATSNTYGTARTAGAGAAIEATPVTVALDTHKEIIEEVEEFDLKRVGIAGVLGRRANSNKASMIRELDKAFFTEGYENGTAVTTTASTTAGKLEELILELETVENSYVDGIDRNMMGLVLTPAYHSALRLEIDDMPSQDNFYAKGAIGLFHGVPVFVSNHMPKGVGQIVSAMVMAVESIAQPVSAMPYTPDRIPLSKAIALELFYDFGTKAVADDLIFYIGDAYSAS